MEICICSVVQTYLLNLCALSWCKCSSLRSVWVHCISSRWKMLNTKYCFQSGIDEARTGGLAIPASVTITVLKISAIWKCAQRAFSFENVLCAHFARFSDAQTACNCTSWGVCKHRLIPMEHQHQYYHLHHIHKKKRVMLRRRLFWPKKNCGKSA